MLRTKKKGEKKDLIIKLQNMKTKYENKIKQI